MEIASFSTWLASFENILVILPELNVFNEWLDKRRTYMNIFIISIQLNIQAHFTIDQSMIGYTHSYTKGENRMIKLIENEFHMKLKNISLTIW